MKFLSFFIKAEGIPQDQLPQWFTGGLVLFSMILFSVWKYMGYYMVIYLAGLQGISSELYEAASLDGANTWQKFRYVTWPQLSSTTFFVVVMLTINCFKVYDIAIMLAGGGSGELTTSATVLVYYIYQKAFIDWDLGYSSSVAMVLFLMVLFVTIIQFLVHGFVPALYTSLGAFLELITVNCIILGRAEAYASKNKPIPSLFDGIGMGLGFTLSITCIGAVRELIGAGSIFGKQILPLADAAAGKMGYEPVTIFILAPGAFFVLAFLSALQNKFKIGAAKRGIDPSNPDCKGGCASCGNSMCSGKRG